MHPPRIQFWRQDVSPLSPPAAPLASPARSKCLLVYCRRVSPVIVSCYLLFVSTCSCEAAFTSTPAPQYTPTFRLIEWTSPTPRSYFYTHTHTHTHTHTCIQDAGGKVNSDLWAPKQERKAGDRDSTDRVELDKSTGILLHPNGPRSALQNLPERKL